MGQALESARQLRAHPAVAPRAEGFPGIWVVPCVVTISLAGHAAALAVATMLPPMHSTEPVFAEFVIEEAPRPPPQPVVEPPAPPPPEPEAVAPVARAARRIVRDEPPVPPAPPPILTTQNAGASDWAHEEGDPDGQVGGQPGGEGAGTTNTEEPHPHVAEESAISRTQLRAMLLDYIRGTLGGYLQGRIDYPLVARREHLEGVVMLRVRLARDGRILAVRLSRSSGHESLDRAALASVQGLGTMPAPPRNIPWDADQELPLPVTYVLQ
jgi:protein TonB